MELVKQDNFNGYALDIFGEQQTYFITRRQIGEALEYNHPQKAIDKIHERHKDKLDRFSVTVNLTATDLKSYGTLDRKSVTLNLRAADSKMRGEYSEVT